MIVSVIIPCYRSSKTISTVVDEVRLEIEKRAGSDYQFILACDASPDGTFDMIRKMCADDSRIIGIELAENVGQQAARMAALPYATGDYIVFMDDDGQHPAQGIFPMIDKLEEGYDIVYARFAKKRHTWIQRFGSYVNRRMTEILIGKPKDFLASSFFVVRPFVVKELQKYKNIQPYIFGYLMQITKHAANIEMEHRVRIEGKSGYTFSKLVALWFNGVIGFSIKPLRIASFLGGIAATTGFIYGISLIVRKLLVPNVVNTGYTSMMAVVLFMGGLLMLMIGLAGEYIGRIFMSASNIPQYVVRDVVNAQDDEPKMR